MSGKKDPKQQDVLFDLDVVEVSIVPEGENDRRFAVFKSPDAAGGASLVTKEQIQKILSTPAASDVAVSGYLNEAAIPDDVKQTAIAGMKLLLSVKDALPPEILDDLVDALEGDTEDVMKMLAPSARAKLPDTAFALPATRAYPMHDVGHAKNALARATGKPEETMVRTAVHAKYPQLNPANAGMAHKLPVKKSADGVETLDLDAIPAEQQPIAKALWDAQVKEKEAIQKAASLSEALITERSEKMSKEFIEKAAQLDKLGVKPEEFGLVMKSLHEKAPEQAAEIEKTLLAANAAVTAAQAGATEAVTKAAAATAAADAKTAELTEVKKSVADLTTKVEKMASAVPAPQASGANATEEAGKAAGKEAVAKGKDSVFKGVL